MATKKELVAELVELGLGDKADLMKKNNRDLEQMLENAYVEEESVESAESPTPAIDVEALKAQMMAELKAKMEADLRKEIEAEVKQEVAEEPKRKVKVENDRLIPIMNITPHQLIYVSKRTGAEWNWGSYGDVEYMEMQELLTMRTAHKRFLDEPWVLLMDDQAVHYLGLEKMYEKMVHPDDIEKVFSMNNEKFAEVVKTAPKGIAQLIAGRAVQKVADGSLDSMFKIKLLNEQFGMHLGE